MNNDTQISPGIGPLPDGFSLYGGIVVDIVGTNGTRLTGQIPPSAIFKGNVPTSPNFLQLCAIPGFDASLSQLGGGIQKCNIRVTLADGNSGSPNPLYSEIFYNVTPGDRMPFSGANAMAPSFIKSIGNFASQPIGYDFDGGNDLYVGLDLGGGFYVNCGYMGHATTFRLDGSGATDRTFTGFPGTLALEGTQFTYIQAYGSVGTIDAFNTMMGRKTALPAADLAIFAVTAWFSVPSGNLANLAAALKSSGQMKIGIYDVDPGDQYYNFGKGVAATIPAIPLFPPAILTFTATPPSASGPTQVTLAWTTQNCGSVSIDNGVGGGLASHGSVVVTVSATTTFRITGTGPNGEAPTTTLTVPWGRPPVSIDSFTAVPSSLRAAGHAVLHWAVSNADSVSISGPSGFASGPLAPTGTILSLDRSVEGTDTYVLTASQTAGTPVTASATVSLAAIPLSIVSGPMLPAADTIHRVYSFVFAALGGFGVYHWSATGVPSGLTLSDDGTLSGTLDEGPTTNFAITVTLTGDGVIEPVVQVFTLPFTRIPLTVTTAQVDLDNQPARELTLYDGFQFVAQYGHGPQTWSIVGGHLPDGMSLSSLGQISGTPAMYGYWDFTVQVTTPTETATKSFELMVRYGWARLDPFHEVFYRVLNTDETPVLVNGVPLCNDPHPEIGGAELFSQFVVAFEVGTTDFTVTDARVEGGGLAPEFQTIEAARNFFDLGYWDGKPYPVGGGLIIQLPMSLLDRMSRDEVSAKIGAILPLGTLPVIRYYDATGEESL